MVLNTCLSQRIVANASEHTSKHVPKTKVCKDVHAKPQMQSNSREHRVLLPKEAFKLTSCSLAMAITLYQALPANALPSLDSSGTVPVRREIVEEMLVQRFQARVKTMSDAELATAMETLLAENAAFPTSLLQNKASPPGATQAPQVPTTSPPSPSSFITPNQTQNPLKAMIEASDDPMDRTSGYENNTTTNNDAKVGSGNELVGVPKTMSEVQDQVNALVRQFEHAVGASGETLDLKTLAPPKSSTDSIISTSPASRVLRNLSGEDAIKILALVICGPTALVALYSLFRPGSESEDPGMRAPVSDARINGAPNLLIDGDMEGYIGNRQGETSSAAAAAGKGTGPDIGRDSKKPWWSWILKESESEAIASPSTTSKPSIGSPKPSTAAVVADQIQRQAVSAWQQPTGRNGAAGGANSLMPPPPPPVLGFIPQGSGVGNVNGTSASQGGIAGGVLWKRKDRDGGSSAGSPTSAAAAAGDRVPGVPGNQRLPESDAFNGVIAAGESVRGQDLWRVPLEELHNMPAVTPSMNQSPTDSAQLSNNNNGPAADQQERDGIYTAQDSSSEDSSLVDGAVEASGSSAAGNESQPQELKGAPSPAKEAPTRPLAPRPLHNLGSAMDNIEPAGFGATSMIRK